jgi:hypothetical protein
VEAGLSDLAGAAVALPAVESPEPLEFDALLAGVALEALPDSGLPAAALPPSRKSVTYQPEPLSWKPAAVTCFENVLFPQDGQTVNTGSDIFCSTSLACPQDSHL